MSDSPLDRGQSPESPAWAAEIPSIEDGAHVDRGRGDRIARALVWPLLITLFVLTIVFYVVFTPFQVVGDSMEPSLLEQDRVLRTKAYATPHRGEVVIVDIAEGSSEEDIVKRVVAVAGDTVEIVDDVAIVNGKAEDVSKLLIDAGHGERREPSVVPKGHVYVLGDNRPVSLDSRFVGPLPLENVRGRAVFVFLPPDRFGPVR